MRASILIGVHNEGDRLWKTVESVLETMGKLDAEVLVADDGSTDDSLAELKRRFPRIVVVKGEERIGVGAARGLAASRARGDVLVFLDGHTKPEAGALQRLVSSVEKTKGEAVITPQIVGLDEKTWKSHPQQIGHGYALDLETFDSWWLPLKKMREVKEARQTFFESPALVGCALAVSRDLYDRLWGFDPHMRQWGNEDLDFALKAWTMGARVLHDPEATVAHRFQRDFADYEVNAEYPLANQIRSARKHFTQSAWEDWLTRAQQQQRLRLKGHPEGLWTSAWEVFQRDRQSAEHERAYLLSHRVKDEFWFAKHFDRSWPSMGGAAAPTLLKQAALPAHILFAKAMGTPAPSLVQVTFTGGIDIQQDNGSGIYTAPQWLPSQQNPYLIQAGQTLTVDTVQIKLSADLDPLPKFRGTASDDSISFGETEADLVSGSTDVYEATITADSAFTSNQTAYYNTFDIDWEVSVDGGATWKDAGTSSNIFYVCLDSNSGSNPYRTVVHLACSNDGASSADDAAMNTWALFTSGGSGPSNVTTWDGQPLYYYQPGTTFSLAENPITVSGLLSVHSGECVAWACLLKSAWAVNGATCDYILAQCLFATEFFVNDWSALTSPGPFWFQSTATDMIPTPSSGYYDNPSNPQYFYNDDSVPGQGDSSPSQKIFQNHQFLYYNGTYYDPSYGVTYSSAADFQTHLTGYANSGGSYVGYALLEFYYFSGSTSIYFETISSPCS